MVRLRTRQQALLHSSWSREHDGQVAHTNHAGTGAPSHAGIVIGYVAVTGARHRDSTGNDAKNYSGSSRSLQPKATCSCATLIPAAWRSMTSPTTRSLALDRHGGPGGSIRGSAILAATIGFVTAGSIKDGRPHRRPNLLADGADPQAPGTLAPVQTLVAAAIPRSN